MKSYTMFINNIPSHLFIPWLYFIKSGWAFHFYQFKDMVPLWILRHFKLMIAKPSIWMKSPPPIIICSSLCLFHVQSCCCYCCLWKETLEMLNLWTNGHIHYTARKSVDLKLILNSRAADKTPAYVRFLVFRPFLFCFCGVFCFVLLLLWFCLW